MESCDGRLGTFKPYFSGYTNRCPGTIIKDQNLTLMHRSDLSNGTAPECKQCYNYWLFLIWPVCTMVAHTLVSWLHQCKIITLRQSMNYFQFVTWLKKESFEMTHRPCLNVYKHKRFLNISPALMKAPKNYFLSVWKPK